MQENLSEQAFCKLLTAIAAKLGDGWTAEPNKPEGNFYRGTGYLKDQTGRKLYIAADSYQLQGRIAVYISLNKAKGKSIPEIDAPHAITLDYKRHPAALAHDIKWRVLPSLVILWAKNEAEIKRVTAREEAHQARLDLFASRYNGNKSESDRQIVHIHNSKVILSSSKNKVTLYLKDLPQEFALCMLDIYHAAMTQGTQS